MISYPVPVGELVVRVIEGGRGDDHVVFVHGIGARADRWERNIDALATAGFHTWALDLPGHGFSSKVGVGDMSVPTMAAFVREFLGVVGVERVRLVGASYGGHVCAHLAVGSPDLVDQLILVNSMGLAPLGDDVRQAIARSIVRTDLDSIRQSFTTVLFEDPKLVTDEWVREESMVNRSTGAAESLAAAAHYIEHDIDRDVVGEALAALHPALRVHLIWGEGDPVLGGDFLERSRASVPTAGFDLMPSTRHAPYLEHDERFNALVVRALARSQ